MSTSFIVQEDIEWPDLDKFQEELVKAVVSEIKQRTPVRTGKLRDSINGAKEGDALIFGSDVEYAGFIEFGTRYIEPQAMFRTTIEQIDQISERVASKLNINGK